MLFLFRSSFITAAFVCVVAVIGQFATVHAAPQFGMRPKFNLLGAEDSGSAFSSLASPTATVDVDGSTSSAVLSPEVSGATPETTQAPDSPSSDSTGTEIAAATNAAVSSASQLGVALFVGSIAAIIQIF